MTRRCPNCGIELRPRARFCDKCGFQLKDSGATFAMSDIPPEEEGSTLFMSDQAGDADELDTRPSHSVATDEGSTLFMPGEPEADADAEADADEGSTLFMPGEREAEADADEGSTLFMPGEREPEADADEGSTLFMPGERDAEAEADEGSTLFMPGESEADADAEADADEGSTLFMPDTDNRSTQPSMPAVALPPEEEAESPIPRTGPALEADDGLTGVMPSPVEEAAPPQPIAEDAVSPQAAVLSTPVKVGRVLQERYRLERELGRGGFGAVYLAQDIKLRRACVVKQMLIPEGTPKRDIKLYQSNFEREASLLVQLNHPGHPNIPEIFDYFSETSGNYLVMKYIEGQSLKDIVEDGEGRIPWREAVRYTIDVCDALNYMHTLGKEPIMHRDIKPANVLLGDDRRVWLVDFGLAKADPVEGSTDIAATQAAGSVGYTPLEQWLGEAEPASDVYALGATLHHLTTGQSPLEAYEGEYNIEKIQGLHGEFAPLRKVDRSLPKELEAIVAQAVSAEPEERPTALQLKQLLEGVLSGAQRTALFTFKSGESANTLGEFVDLCDKYKEEAQGYLYNGDFERWFLIINRNDLAEAAVQAVKRGKDRRDGLEKFLKLIMPNIFLRRMRKAAWHVTRLGVQTILIFVVVVLLVLIGSSYVARWFIQQSISSYDWNYSALKLERNNYYTERFLTEKFRAVTGAYLDEVEVDVQSPDRLVVSASLVGLPIRLPVSVRLEEEQPRFAVSEINDMPLYLVGENISKGLNAGVEGSFRRGPVDVTSLDVRDGVVIFGVEESGRAPFIRPTPQAATTPTPTPVTLSLVAIFNELDRDVILELDGESFSIPRKGSRVLEKEPGAYEYIIRYAETGQVAAQGTKEWGLRVYRWHLNILE